ncbi:hypothetical protein VSH64_47465 [Amycolatopsis rhabdoformis]|uniref:WXG100 family type VII secretion target n=1 Tax=Amycolatopsis rhabdoformis TaxID=1448059 RepID=A0ABZ1I8W0_9PSEU|nr:hypothetical protein [Amycolatopsis rhabdoformis]WSE30348.1 hypothetical protein VSH64_47465 [Amycolatopsis rhabdoformis]
MTGGFDAVTEDLERAADTIGDVVGSAAGLLWQGPSGDYGHAGVQAGWGSFVDDLKSVVDGLAGKAQGHGEDLRTAAVRYAAADGAAGDSIVAVASKALDALGGHGKPSSGGAFFAPLSGALARAAEEPRGPEWTGGGTGRISGSIDDGPAGVMSPERSRQLFPGARAGVEENPVDENPVDTDGPVF